MIKGMVDLRGLDNLMARVAELETPDARPLMVTFQKLIVDGNRRGVLAGLDKDGKPMRPVTYRPVGKVAKLTPSQRNTTNNRARKGIFGGLGLHASGLHNNLSSSEYRKLGGPPLAPRGAFSRVITNLRTGFEWSSDFRVWEAYGFWDEVLSTKGVRFLSAHFKGGGRLPTRDLRGVRPEEMEKARRAAIAWMADLVRVAVTSRSAA